MWGEDGNDARLIKLSLSYRYNEISVKSTVVPYDAQEMMRAKT